MDSGATDVGSAAQNHRPDYIPRLDGLRAIAVGSVVLAHFEHIDTIDGVRLFFVLSGFLITRILFDQRDRGEAVTTAAKNFYWRRALRIFPAYYAAIAITAAIGVANVREVWLTNVLYLANIRVALQGHWGASGHFWSLAVEEQFYLIWFAVVIILPRRWLLPFIFIAIIGAPLFRAGMLAAGFVLAPYVLLPGCADALGWGALLAVAMAGKWNKTFDGWLAPIAAIVLIGLCDMVLTDGLLALAIEPTMFDIGAALLIGNCASARPASAFSWLEWAPLRHIGRISYGIYIWHQFVARGLRPYLPTPATIPHLIILILVTLTIAEASWWFMERPLLRLKGRYHFSARRRGAVL